MAQRGLGTFWERFLKKRLYQDLNLESPDP